MLPDSVPAANISTTVAQDLATQKNLQVDADDQWASHVVVARQGGDMYGIEIKVPSHALLALLTTVFGEWGSPHSTNQV